MPEIGVPALLILQLPDVVKCKSVAEVKEGKALIELAFPPNPVTILANVTKLPPILPKFVPAE